MLFLVPFLVGVKLPVSLLDYLCTNMDGGDLFSRGATTACGPGPSHFRDFTITLTHTTLGSAPLDEWPDRRRDLYLTTHNNHNRQTSMPRAGFEPEIPVSERPQPTP